MAYPVLLVLKYLWVFLHPLHGAIFVNKYLMLTYMHVRGF